jgi:hypothetical protein
MAVNFNGTTDYYAMAGNAAAVDIATNASMSLVCWVNLPTLTPLAQGQITGKGYDGTNGAYAFSVTVGPPTFNWGSFNNTSGSHGLTPTLATLGWAANSWHHVYGDYNSGTTTWNLYVDGVFNASSVDAVGPFHTTTRFTIGANDVIGTIGQYEGACIADVAVFSGPLTTTEIGNLGNGTLRPNTSMSKTLLAYFPLNGGAHTQSDLSGNGNTVTAGSTDPTTCSSSPPFLLVMGVPRRRIIRR